MSTEPQAPGEGLAPADPFAPPFDPFDPSEVGGNAGPSEAEELGALAHAIRLSEGFKLFFVQHDGPAQRERLLSALQTQLADRPLQILHFDAPLDHLLHALRPRLPELHPAALCLTGLEESIFDPSLGPPAPKSSGFLANLNATRNAFPAALGCPLVVALTEYTLSLLARDAPDFFSIRSGHFRFRDPTRAAPQGPEDIRERDDLRSLAQRQEEQGEGDASQGRYRQAEEHFRAALDYVLALGDPLAAARIQRRRGLNFVALGQDDLATRCLQQALAHLDAAAPSATEPRLAETGALAEGVVFEVHEALAQRPGTAPLHRQLLTQVTQALDQLRDEGLGRNDLALLRLRAIAASRSGDLALTHDNLDLATREYQQALALLEDLASRQPGNPEAKRDLSISLNQLGSVVFQRGELDEATRLYARSLDIAESLAAADPRDAQAQRDLSVNLNNLGNVALQRRELNEATRLYARALDIAESLAAADPRDAQAQRDLSVSLEKLGAVALGRGELMEAAQRYRRALQIVEHLAAASPQNVVVVVAAAVSRLRDHLAELSSAMAATGIPTGAPRSPPPAAGAMLVRGDNSPATEAMLAGTASPALPRTPTRASLRRLLLAILPTASGFDAFVFDYFPAVARMFSAAMPRTTRTNLLLAHAAPLDVLTALRLHAPDRIKRYESLLQFEP